MSNQTVKALSTSFGISCSLLKQFIKVCPKNIWEENFGGWPIWHQVYHALNAVDFFTMGAGLPASTPPLAEEAASLEAWAGDGLSQEKMLGYAAEMEEKGKAFLNSLNDAQLAQKNEALSKELGDETTYAAVIAMMSGHTLYHLGSCDAALRQHGLKGVF